MAKTTHTDPKVHWRKRDSEGYRVFDSRKKSKKAAGTEASTCTSESGKICGDTFQESFLEWTYSRYEVKKICQVQHFECPACTPVMLAASADGNRKYYRFRKATCTDRHVNATSHGVEQQNDAEHGQSIISKIHEDSNKRRHRIRRKILDEKRKFSEAIAEYNDLVPDSDRIDSLDEILAAESHAWPWELHGSETAVGLYTKKRVFDKVMLL
ncbi:hypothetical protein EOD39_19383 [Acipenser ruthenus]|uniref:Uncharacterized protein n=1 Tax=Acipenser ruthenus TaxID=7906 RepID=A0A444UY95_ACIRT|nr:hypothetical protein EOD39_19383 [Acipenser ruthenus]